MSHSHRTGAFAPVSLHLHTQTRLTPKDAAVTMHACLSAGGRVKVKHGTLWCERLEERVEGGRDKEAKLKGNDEG